MDSFNCLRSREGKFSIDDHMKRQVHLSKSIRTLLVDWILEIQETFKLSHETLYVTVMLVDVFLCEVVTNKDKMQLLGASALLTASKFHEKCNLRTIGYDVGMLLSYCCLQRYVACGEIAVSALTLARHILELFLMDYDTISFSYSTTGAAALFVTSRMVGENQGC
uniref:Cyclin-like domain-containing protein n=1 Tax=Glossina palpalis gambiensis TaxID=67801 RepID=A0A1B0B4T4_9MUSC